MTCFVAEGQLGGSGLQEHHQNSPETIAAQAVHITGIHTVTRRGTTQPTALTSAFNTSQRCPEAIRSKACIAICAACSTRITATEKRREAQQSASEPEEARGGGRGTQHESIITCCRPGTFSCTQNPLNARNTAELYQFKRYCCLCRCKICRYSCLKCYTKASCTNPVVAISGHAERVIASFCRAHALYDCVHAEVSQVACNMHMVGFGKPKEQGGRGPRKEGTRAAWLTEGPTHSTGVEFKALHVPLTGRAYVATFFISLPAGRASGWGKVPLTQYGLQALLTWSSICMRDYPT